VTKDYLWLNLRELPYFRSLVRANESLFYQQLEFPRPILDVGSGDGHFAARTFDRPIDVGIDPWSGPVRKSIRYGIYQLVIQGNAAQIPFANASFGSAISNSVLEHIPDVDSVLQDVARVLQPGAPFYFCVPNHRFLSSLSIGGALDQAGLGSLGSAYRRFFNRISRHYHCDSPETWQARLNRHGFSLERWWHYLPPQGFHHVEWGHYFGLPSLLIHAVSRRWILVPQEWNLHLTRRMLAPYYGPAAVSDEGVYTFYIARRNA
jgi:SAM-dependent methyltransferase